MFYSMVTSSYEAQLSETDTAEKQLRLVKILNKKLPANSAHQIDMLLMFPQPLTVLQWMQNLKEVTENARNFIYMSMRFGGLPPIELVKESYKQQL